MIEEKRRADDGWLWLALFAFLLPILVCFVIVGFSEAKLQMIRECYFQRRQNSDFKGQCARCVGKQKETCEVLQNLQMECDFLYL